MQTSSSELEQETGRSAEASPDTLAAADGAAEQVAGTPTAPSGDARESARGRSRRHARRSRLYVYALIAVALAAATVALAASNTAKAKVSWVLGSSHVSLVWMVLATAVLGWLLGLFTAAALHRRTRAPR